MKFYHACLYRRFFPVTFAVLIFTCVETSIGQVPATPSTPTDPAPAVDKSAKEKALEILSAAEKIAICMPMPPAGHIVAKALKGDVKVGTPWNDKSFPKEQLLVWQKANPPAGKGESTDVTTGFYPLDEQGRVVIPAVEQITLTPGEILTFLKIQKTKDKAGVAPQKERK